MISKNKKKKENSDFICEVCGKVFSRKYNLERHEKDYNHKLSEGKRKNLFKKLLIQTLNNFMSILFFK